MNAVSFSQIFAFLNVRQHFFEQFKSWDCIVELVQVVRKLEEIFQEDSYNLLKKGLDPFEQLFILNAPLVPLLGVI